MCFCSNLINSGVRRGDRDPVRHRPLHRVPDVHGGDALQLVRDGENLNQFELLYSKCGKNGTLFVGDRKMRIVKFISGHVRLV